MSRTMTEEQRAAKERRDIRRIGFSDKYPPHLAFSARAMAINESLDAIVEEFERTPAEIRLLNAVHMAGVASALIGAYVKLGALGPFAESLVMDHVMDANARLGNPARDAVVRLNERFPDEDDEESDRILAAYEMGHEGLPQDEKPL